MDTGPLYAYVDAGDRRHEECLDLLYRHPGPLIVPVLVIAEAAYFIGARIGAEAEVRFLGDLASGNFIVEPVQAGDWLRITELVYRYRDVSLGTVDASVATTAERLGISTIITLDRRHFSIIRPAHTPVFELLP